MSEPSIVPEEWQQHELGRYIRIKHGFAFQSDHFVPKGQHTLLTPGNFNMEGGFRELGSKQKYYDGHIPDGYILNRDQLLVAMTEQAPGLLGSAILVPEGGRYLHNQRLGLVEICDEEAVDNRFLYFLFNSEDVRVTLATTASGTKVKHTSPSKICDVKVWMPLLEEQRKIAETLSTWDEAIEQQTRLLALKRERKRGLMHQLLTGKVRFKEFEGLEWRKLKLADVVDLLKDGTHGTHEHFENGVPLLSAKDIIDGKILLNNEPRLISLADYGKIHKNYFIQKNDLLLTIVGTLGRVALVKTEARFTVQRSVAIIRAGKKLLPEYLYFCFQSRGMQKALQGSANASAQAGVYLGELAKLGIYLPNIEEQQKIASVLSAADAELETLQTQLSALRLQKRGLMQRLLTGRTRVKLGREVAAS